MINIRIFLVLFIFISPFALGYDSSELEQPITIGDIEVAYPEFAIFKLPGTKLSLQAASPIDMQTASGVEQNITELTVPVEQGWHHYQLTNTNTDETLLLHVFSLIPRSKVNKKGYLNHFKVGHYPTTRLNNQAIYDPPAGFIEVAKKDMRIKVSPNFTVGQFLSKQRDAFPKYLTLRPELIIKMERILRALNLAGQKTDSFHVMSGFRTPSYNRAIGNVAYSRHQWGGAADIFIDNNPKDNVMDDLNGDGKNNRKDAVWLAKFINEMSLRGDFNNIGGLGIYGSTAAHGPFVHVDVRGKRARW